MILLGRVAPTFLLANESSTYLLVPFPLALVRHKKTKYPTELVPKSSLAVQKLLPHKVDMLGEVRLLGFEKTTATVANQAKQPKFLVVPSGSFRLLEESEKTEGCTKKIHPPTLSLGPRSTHRKTSGSEYCAQKQTNLGLAGAVAFLEARRLILPHARHNLGASTLS